MAAQGGRRGLGPVQRPRLYEHLAQHISEFIEAQGLVAGDRLPPERQLARDLGVSRATLSQALAALETQGKVEVRHGVGALVRQSVPVDGGLAVRIATRPRDEVVAAREATLTGLARAAAANPAKSMRIAMLGEDGTVPSWVEVWRMIRRLAGNELLTELDEQLAAGAPDPADDEVLSARLSELAAAIVRGDVAGAGVLCIGLLAAPAGPDPVDDGFGFTT